MERKFLIDFKNIYLIAIFLKLNLRPLNQIIKKYFLKNFPHRLSLIMIPLFNKIGNTPKLPLVDKEAGPTLWFTYFTDLSKSAPEKAGFHLY